ncbi:rod shape-determining protein MreC [Arenibaculum pallidiluteum]|uniref:rod shape-determining protein MreC n=1 Tax=Arenibaculum pallidiluteum TaxID=2812559 RepID=UPI001A967EFB|nr:rod shape-determining protein MreC [Arenibaculum pallidiluteum]
MKSRANGSVLRLAAPLRAFAHRFSFALLLMAAVGLMMVGKADTVVVEGVRARIVDAFTPILGAFSAPAASAARMIEAADELVRLHAENDRLRRENELLTQWQQAALRLEAENRSLRGLLNVQADPQASFVTARVVADAGGAYVRSLIVTAGRRDGVKRGQAALSGHGVVGRVVEVGEWSSRILLITDLNARLPVVVEPSRTRAVLGGDNADQPRLLYLPPEAPVSVGDRVVTSGHGGLMPAGLPVGVVSYAGERGVRIQPFEDLGRIEHVQLVDFGGTGSLVGDTGPAVEPAEKVGMGRQP